MNPDLIAIGKIVAPHGVRGDVRVIPLTDFPERFQQLKEVYVGDAGQVLTVENPKFHKQFILVKFRGLNDRNAVENLRGKLIQIRRADVMPLPQGHYYLFDIIGMDVYTVEGAFLGVIADVLQTGSNDVYIVEKEGQQPVLVPALKKVVISVDITGKKMVVRLLEEWE